MKINVTVDCTPKELRDFLGWPDVEPLQREMMENLSKAMGEGIGSTEAMNMMRPFIAPNLQAFEAMQSAFLQAFQTGSGGKRKKSD